MIVRERPTVWELVGMWRLSILPRIAGQLAVMIAWSCIVVWLTKRYAAILHIWSIAPFTLLGVALSIFLGFRNSACYERWWEARKQLGALVGETRSFARICTSLPSIDPRARERLLRGTIAFAGELMRSLRAASPQGVPAGMPSKPGRPDAILRELGVCLGEQLTKGAVGEQVYKHLDERLIAFAAIQAACERLRSMPMPFTYTLLVYRTAYAYCFLLPFGLANTMGWVTPLLASLVAYTFFGLDALGDELEDPFGDHANALPLTALARTIEISLLETLGVDPVPAQLQPIDFVLT